MTLQQLYLVLLAGGLVLLASIVATRAATTVGLPALLLFLGVGVIVGEDGLGLHFENYLLADHLGTVALAIILIEGGLTTRFSDVRRVLAPAGMLATLGVAVSMVITAAGAHLLLGMDWQLAFLLGAIVSSTDAAAVFSVLRVVPLPQACRRTARGRVRIQRRARRHPRADVLALRRWNCRRCTPSASWSTSSVSAPRSGWVAGSSAQSRCAA